MRGNWQDYYWQDASRGHLAIAELLVSIATLATENVEETLLLKITLWVFKVQWLHFTVKVDKKTHARFFPHFCVRKNYPNRFIFDWVIQEKNRVALFEPHVFGAVSSSGPTTSVKPTTTVQPTTTAKITTVLPTTSTTAAATTTLSGLHITNAAAVIATLQSSVVETRTSLATSARTLFFSHLSHRLLPSIHHSHHLYSLFHFLLKTSLCQNPYYCRLLALTFSGLSPRLHGTVC